MHDNENENETDAARSLQRGNVPLAPSQIEHRYGRGIHILADPLALTLLARLGGKGVEQPEVGWLCQQLYRFLAQTVLAVEFPRRVAAFPTRMIDTTPLGVWTGEILDPSTFTVIVALARAGLGPSQVTYDFLNHVLDPSHVRQDHLSLGRQMDAEGRVTGALLDAAKIGGPIDDAFVLIPDPMGATGATVSTALGHYDRTVRGHPRKIIAMHLIVTPEYLRHVQATTPDIVVYALRLDRGLSSADVLQTVPGTHWDDERGLTDRHYIVPGAGGLGEVLNNSFV